MCVLIFGDCMFGGVFRVSRGFGVFVVFGLRVLVQVSVCRNIEAEESGSDFGYDYVT